MTNEEREKHIRIANMLIGAINDLERPMLMYQIEKDVAKEALENYIKMLEQQPCKDAEEHGMNEQMQFPETFEEFAKEFGFKDDKEVYTNGSDLIPIFRVKQWLEQNMANESIKALDKLDFIIVEQLDKSTDFKECMTLRWVLDKIAEVGE